MLHHIKYILSAFLCLFFISIQILAVERPSNGRCYILTDKQTGLAVSNQGNPDNDIHFHFEKKNIDDLGQIWLLKQVKENNSTAFIITDPIHNTAFDAAMHLKEGYILQWSASTSNPNQIFIFEEYEDGFHIRLQGRNEYLYMSKYKELMRTQDKTAASIFSLTEVEKPIVKKNKWENPEFYRENNLPAHATILPYASAKEWEKDHVRAMLHPWENPKSSVWKSLNGDWKILWQDHTQNMPTESFWGEHVDTESWKTIPIPSCLEMYGYGDPLYINVEYAFQDCPPFIRMKKGLKNSVGSLRRSFSIDKTWKGQRIVLHFDGIYGATSVYINGQYVGYTEEANNVSEFDITEHVHEGENSIAVQIIRWSDASYLEGQDIWHMSGIHRDVYLYATPKVYIHDYALTDNVRTLTHSGDLNINTIIGNTTNSSQDINLRYTLFDNKGKEIIQETQNILLKEGENYTPCIQQFKRLRPLQLWHPETPYLYTLRIDLLDASGEPLQTISTRYGFRTIEIKKGQLFINNKRAFLFGANTQDTHPLLGRCMDIKTMLRDIHLMKQANMNIVRTSHYPRQAKMMDMFDSYGLFVVDEADVECHKSWADNGGNCISNIPQWRSQMVDRIVQLVYRDRNHPSVLFWSMGNESAAGENFNVAFDSIKKIDPTRPIHYEGATCCNGSCTDIWSTMYPSLERVKNDANNNWRQQPYFMCEYAHAMGNAVGNLKEYVDLIKKSKYGVGGCIWDFVDQSIYDAKDIANKTLFENGYPKYISGYDKPGPHQGNFVNNGLINADRKWSAELEEVKKVYQKIDIHKITNEKLTLLNHYDALDLSSFYLSYAYTQDGDTIQHGSLPLSCHPGKSVSIELPSTEQELSPYHDLALNVAVRLNEATLWAPQHYAVATEQFILTEKKEDPYTITPGNSLEVKENKYEISIKNQDMHLLFRRSSGLVKWEVRGSNMLSLNGSPTFNHFRYIENDKGTYMPDNGILNTNWNLQCDQKRQQATLHIEREGNRANIEYCYTIHACGTIDLEIKISPKVSGLRRLGFSMSWNSSFQNVDYYACGPWSNYIDRCQSAYLTHVRTTIPEMLEIFAHPQSTGNHLNLRHLTLSNNEGKGIYIEAGKHVSFTALPYHDSQLYTYKHMWELPTSSQVITHFDYIQQGVGNGSCGPGTINKYMCPSNGTYTYRLRFIPLELLTNGIEELTPISTIHTENIYDIQGRKVETKNKGSIYIQNNKKQFHMN